MANTSTSKLPKPLRVLIVEDSEDDATLLMDYLSSVGYLVDWLRVEDEQAMLSALERGWDIVFSDYTMPQFSGARALQILRQLDPDLPFIFVSGTIGEEAAVQAMKSGAQDYIMKGHLSRLPHALERELREVRERRERRQAEETLRKVSLVVQQAADSVFITDPAGHIEYVNPAFEKLTGYSEEEVKGNTPSILRSGYHSQEFYKQLWDTIMANKVYSQTLINRRKNGELFHEEKVITPLKDEHDRITHFVSTGRDITERIQAEEARTRLAAILEATPDMVAMLAPDGGLRYLNGAGRRILGLAADDALEGRSLQEILPEAMAQQFVVDVIPAAQRDGMWSGESVFRIADGKELPVSQVVLAHPDASGGGVDYLSVIARDISERKRFEAELHRRATHDSLTDLPNRFFLLDRFKLALQRSRRSHKLAAVLFVDLDNFKRVNDSLGHAAGDNLLQQVARRLENYLRPNDTIARHGGDEFTIVVEDLERADCALAVIRNLHMAFERPFIIGTHEVYVTFSTGIALFPHDGTQVEDLLRNADTAMYQAKASGSNQYRFYAPDMNARGHELLTLEADLRHALENDEFLLYFQPQLDLGSNRIIGAEGLLRWQHPVRGLISPADFIPLLENSGLIIPVGEWVLRQACIVHRKWREAQFTDLRISVNVSATQFQDEDLLGKVHKTIKEENMPPQSLELEITENVIMADPIKAAEILQALHNLGVRTTIDDFGTGYSSLAYLKRFPLNVLKIDRTFVGDLTEDDNDAAIVEASISLAHRMGLEVVAEGVETLAQLEFLRAHHCDLAQGYYLGRPLPRDVLMKLLQHNVL